MYKLLNKYIAIYKWIDNKNISYVCEYNNIKMLLSHNYERYV